MNFCHLQKPINILPLELKQLVATTLVFFTTALIATTAKITLPI